MQSPGIGRQSVIKRDHRTLQVNCCKHCSPRIDRNAQYVFNTNRLIMTKTTTIMMMMMTMMMTTTTTTAD